MNSTTTTNCAQVTKIRHTKKPSAAVAEEDFPHPYFK